MTALRIACCVPFCSRTRPSTEPLEEPDNVWICARHWSAVPRDMRAVKRRARAALRRANNPADGRPRLRYMRVSARVTREALRRAL